MRKKEVRLIAVQEDMNTSDRGDVSMKFWEGGSSVVLESHEADWRDYCGLRKRNRDRERDYLGLLQ